MWVQTSEDIPPGKMLFKGRLGAVRKSPSLLVLLVVVLPLTQLLVIHQVSEGLGGDGHHVGEDEAAVAAGCQHQLVVAVIVADAPNPWNKQMHQQTS